MNRYRALLKASNSVVANINNTNELGLINGNMSLCLFLYRFYLMDKKDSYLDIACMLFNDIISQLKKNKIANSISQMAEIGVGLWSLYDEGFFSSVDIKKIICQLDKIILKRPYFLQSADKKRNSQDIFYQGIYLHKRIQHEQFGQIEEYIHNFSYKVDDYVKRQDETLSYKSNLYWRVMKFVFEHVLQIVPADQSAQDVYATVSSKMLKDDEKTLSNIRHDDWLPYLLCQTIFQEMELPDILSSTEIYDKINNEIQNLYYNKHFVNARISIMANFLMSKQKMYEN